jgi:hypothetical protein
LRGFRLLAFGGGSGGGVACDSSGMNRIPEDPRPLRTLPLYSDNAKMNRLYADPRREIERRADFIRAQVARDRHPESAGEALDPVLRFHLGLEETPL